MLSFSGCLIFHNQPIFGQAELFEFEHGGLNRGVLPLCAGFNT